MHPPNGLFATQPQFRTSWGWSQDRVSTWSEQSLLSTCKEQSRLSTFNVHDAVASQPRFLMSPQFDPS